MEDVYKAIMQSNTHTDEELLDIDVESPVDDDSFQREEEDDEEDHESNRREGSVFHPQASSKEDSDHYDMDHKDGNRKGDVIQLKRISPSRTDSYNNNNNNSLSKLDEPLSSPVDGKKRRIQQRVRRDTAPHHPPLPPHHQPYRNVSSGGRSRNPVEREHSPQRYSRLSNIKKELSRAIKQRRVRQIMLDEVRNELHATIRDLRHLQRDHDELINAHRKLQCQLDSANHELVHVKRELSQSQMNFEISSKENGILRTNNQVLANAVKSLQSLDTGADNAIGNTANSSNNNNTAVRSQVHKESIPNNTRQPSPPRSARYRRDDNNYYRKR